MEKFLHILNKLCTEHSGPSVMTLMEAFTLSLNIITFCWPCSAFTFDFLALKPHIFRTERIHPPSVRVNTSVLCTHVLLRSLCYVCYCVFCFLEMLQLPQIYASSAFPKNDFFFFFWSDKMKHVSEICTCSDEFVWPTGLVTISAVQQ